MEFLFKMEAEPKHLENSWFVENEEVCNYSIRL
jgi:hypothetical protein